MVAITNKLFVSYSPAHFHFPINSQPCFPVWCGSFVVIGNNEMILVSGVQPALMLFSKTTNHVKKKSKKENE